MSIFEKLAYKIVTIWVQIRDLYLYFFRHAIIVNAYVDDHTWQGIRHRNWGDDLNYYFIRELTGRPIVFYHNFKFAKWFHLKNYLCIGTLLDADNCSNTQTVVWGSGVSGLERPILTPRQILSVRGKETKKFLVQHGVSCPEIYGDPALLLPMIYQPQRRAPLSAILPKEGNLFETRNTKHETNKYRLGIIPNIADFEHPFVKWLLKEDKKEIVLIDLAKYILWTDIIDLICSCDFILSSSLHGIIVADIYQIPNCWICLTGKAIVGNLKFKDYASSVGRYFEKPIKIDNIEDCIGLINNSESYFSFAEMGKIKEVQMDILSVAPFKCRV